MIDTKPGSVALRHALHTLKGNAAVYGARSVAQACHAFEDQLADGAGQSNDTGRARLRRAWEAMRARVRPYLERDRGRVELDQRDVAGLAAMLRDRVDHDRVIAVVNSWAFEPVGAILDRTAAQGRRIAAGLGKEVEVKVEHEGERVPSRPRCRGAASTWAPSASRATG